MIQILFLAFLLCFVAGAEGPGGHGIYRTTDRGRSWSRSDHGLPGDVRINAFAGLGGTVFAGTDGGVYVSVDQGLNWKLAGGTGALRVISMAATGGRVFAGTDRTGIVVSVDQAVNWRRLDSFPAKNVRSLLTHEGKIFAGTDEDGVLMSGDGGETWVSLIKGLPEGGQVFALTGLKGRLFAGLYAKGLFGWSEDERQWTRLSRVVPLELAAVGGTLIAGHNPGGIHWSDSAGLNWAQATALRGDLGELTGGAPVWKLGAGNGYALAGAAEGIYYSEDRGRNWTRARSGLPMDAPGISFHFGEQYALAGLLLR